jgi:hypothetical protein
VIFDDLNTVLTRRCMLEISSVATAVWTGALDEDKYEDEYDDDDEDDDDVEVEDVAVEERTGFTA